MTSTSPYASNQPKYVERWVNGYQIVVLALKIILTLIEWRWNYRKFIYLTQAKDYHRGMATPLKVTYKWQSVRLSDNLNLRRAWSTKPILANQILYSRRIRETLACNLYQRIVEFLDLRMQCIWNSWRFKFKRNTKSLVDTSWIKSRPF